MLVGHNRRPLDVIYYTMLYTETASQNSCLSRQSITRNQIKMYLQFLSKWPGVIPTITYCVSTLWNWNGGFFFWKGLPSAPVIICLQFPSSRPVDSVTYAARGRTLDWLRARSSETSFSSTWVFRCDTAPFSSLRIFCTCTPHNPPLISSHFPCTHCSPFYLKITQW